MAASTRSAQKSGPISRSSDVSMRSAIVDAGLHSAMPSGAPSAVRTGTTPGPDAGGSTTSLR